MLVIPTQSRRFELCLDACGQPVVRLASGVLETAACRPPKAASSASTVGRSGRFFIARTTLTRSASPLRFALL